MSRHYPESCSECNGSYCLYARYARRELVLTSVHNEPNSQNSQINEFDGPNQFNQQPFVGPNHYIGSFQQHSHYIGPVQHPQIINGPAQQLLILNRLHCPHTHGPDQFPQHPPLINGSDQLPQIAEINNIDDINNIPPANQHIQYPNSQATNSFRNYSIQPPLTPVQANIQINNNLQRQQSFTSQASNTADQHLQDFRNCNCQ
ncbi:2299_t:CDS:1, partial [Racocetra fulgida]